MRVVKLKKLKYCVLIPTYNNCQTLEQVINEILKYTSDVIIINDGSTDETPVILKKFMETDIINFPQNRGKGSAIIEGFRYAASKGFEYAITIDSDGQHLAEDIPSFLKKIKETPDALLIGTRNLNQENISGGSSFANKFSNFWFLVETGIKLPDTQSGFRLYPLKPLCGLKYFTSRFEFEIEVMVRAAWKNIPIVPVPVKVFYPEKEKRISHFRPVTDFLRISLLNTTLVFIAFLYARPMMFFKKLKKKNIKEYLNENLLKSKDSNIKLAVSVGFGIFMGIVPIWGWQLVTAIALAFVFRLNKIIVVLAANISIPPMIPLILYLSYVTGGLVLGQSINIEFSSDINFDIIKKDLIQYIVGSFVFGIISSVCFGFITFVFLKLFREKN